MQYKTNNSDFDVWFYEAFAEETADLKRILPSHIRAGFTEKTIQESGDQIPRAPIISTRSQSIIPIHWAEKVSGILSRSTGFDHLERYIRDAGKPVPCGFLPLYCNRAVAEQTMLLWMALLRKLPQQTNAFKTFYRNDLTGYETAGKTLLVVGVGNIGSEIVRIGAGLGMNVLGVDLVEKHSFVNYTTFDDGIGKADIIVCAMNLTSENAGYFNHDRLLKAKKGAIFVNISRGEISPSTILLKMIEEDRLSGVGLDVYDHESELAESLRTHRESNSTEVRATLALAKKPNVILTPHNAFNTAEAVARKAEQSIRQIDHFLQTGKFLWPAPITVNDK
ncbi:MAG: NAD(P)-dependent oxidoreductase [Candidatus Marinimicrobia bacterium]|nr:NAD(P)-dependent oxidoreductase [Candidatus Neomarinimicrobiota bacterium]